MTDASLPIAGVPEAHRRVLAWIEPPHGDGPGGDINGWHTITRHEGEWYIGEPSLYDSSLLMEPGWIKNWQFLPSDDGSLTMSDQDDLDALVELRERFVHQEAERFVPGYKADIRLLLRLLNTAQLDAAYWRGNALARTEIVLAAQLLADHYRDSLNVGPGLHLTRETQLWLQLRNANRCFAKSGGPGL